MKHIIPSLCAGLVLLASGCGSDENNNAISFDINVTAVNLTGDFTLNGGAFPNSQYENGLISLADANNNLAILGNSYSGSYAASVVSGEYQSMYDLLQGGDTVPANKSAIVASGLSLLIDQPLDIAVTAHLVTFNFTLNGGAFPASEYEDALFYLRPQSGGERFLLGNSHAVIDDVWVIPGTYEIIYEKETGGNQVPVNQNAVVKTVIINADAVVNTNITTVDLILVGTLDGVAFPSNQYKHGQFMLRNSAGDLADLGESYALPLTVKVIEGSYDIIYSHVNGTTVPANKNAVLTSNAAINIGTPTHAVNIGSAEITPEYSLDGGAFANSEYQDAEIYLRGSSADDVFLLGNTHDANPPSVKVIRGTYDVIYRHETGDEVPQNTNAVVQTGAALNADQVLAVAVNSVEITGTFTLNGSGFPANQNETAEFYLRGEEPEDELLLGLSHAGSGSARIIPGTYDVLYKYIAGSAIPRNTENAVMKAVLLDTTQSIRINASAKSIAPKFTLNERPFPTSQYEHAKFYLHGETEADRILIGRSYLNNPTLLVITGQYDVFYEHILGSLIPVNSSVQVKTTEIQ